MKKFLLAFVAAVVLALSPSAWANTCYQWQFTPTPLCTVYGPVAPAGWTWTGGDNNAYPGEVVVCMGYNFTGTCFYAQPKPTLTWNTLGEFDTNQWHIQSIRMNLTGALRVYDGPNLTVGYISWAGGYYAENPHFVNFQISSIYAAN